MRVAILASTLLLAFSTTHGCMWDRDTLASEAKGRPGLTETLTGRFPRFPDQYYEVRLKRVAAEIEENPTDLALYDDAGVAADRLHHGDVAIEWMQRKKAVLDAGGIDQETASEQLYRYHANLGTFLFHQWMRDGANAETLAQAITGRDHIAKAIELNPDAHFGRENYQLMAMDWIIESTNEVKRGNFLIGHISSDNADEAIEGLDGLIRLGDAWQSPDVMFAMNIALMEKRERGLASVAFLRSKELLREGKQSIAGNLMLREDTGGYFPIPYMERGGKLLIDWFSAARKEARTWDERRIEYMSGKFEIGAHPDTDPDFWKAFHYRERPPGFPADGGPGNIGQFFLIIFVISLALVIWLLVRLIRRR